MRTKHLFLMGALLLSNSSYASTFYFKGGVVYGEMSVQQAAAIHTNMKAKFGETMLSKNSSSELRESVSNCFAVCKNHVGYEPFRQAAVRGTGI